MSWAALDVQNFVSIGSGLSAPQIRDFAMPFDVISFYVRFFGFFHKATAYTAKRIFTQNTSGDVVSGKEVPFGGPDNDI